LESFWVPRYVRPLPSRRGGRRRDLLGEARKPTLAFAPETDLLTKGNPLLSAGVFMVSVVSIGVLIAQVRLVTGSIWPAVVMHAAWNAAIQSVFDAVTTGPNALLWTGESGSLVAAVLALLAVAFGRVGLPVRRTRLPQPAAA
jgi:hypothetical protein